MGRLCRTDAAALMGLLAEMRRDLFPSFGPPITAHHIAQGQHGIDMGACPTHPTAFQPRFNDEFVRAFHRPTANGPPRRLKAGIVHLSQPFVQIGQRLLHLFTVGVSFLQLLPLRPYGGRPLMFEWVESLGEPFAGRALSVAQGQCAEGV